MTSNDEYLGQKTETKSQSPLIGDNTNKAGFDDKYDESKLTKEEKLRRRQEKFKAWNLKKNKGKTSDGTEDGTQNSKTGIEKKLEEWKKKRLREQHESDSKSPVGNSATSLYRLPSFKVAKTPSKEKSDNNGFKKKRIAIEDFEGDEDDGAHRPVFKKPSLNLNKQENFAGADDTPRESDDDLDIFLKNLEDEKLADIGAQPNSNLKDIDGEALNSDTDNDEDLEEDEEKKEQDLLSSKLKKFHNKEIELNDVNHSEIDYKPFRKDFYKEPKEIADMTEAEVDLMRLDLGGIRVKGSSPPRPISKWSHLGLPNSIMTILKEKLAYNSPSPIQSQALPAIMKGRDIIGVAKTGSGKTLSFSLPLLRHVQDQPPLLPGDGPIGLIMTPTRELASQIHKEISHFSKRLNISTCCCFGGSSIEPQIGELKKGSQVLVGTPGRIIDLLAANNGRVTNLRRVTYLVLDEADRMFDMGFEPQVMKVVTRIRSDVQIVLFSATFPRKMELLARKILKDPLEIVIGGVSVVPKEIDQRVEILDCDKNDSNIFDIKFNKLLDILSDFFKENISSKVLIFVETQTAADDLLVKLIAKEITCLVIHGGKDQVDRKHAIKDFSSKNSGLDILIATSVAARGLDVKGLDLVINFDAASHLEDYVHRVGRTGRAGKNGTAITFVARDQEKAMADLVRAMKASKGAECEIDEVLLENSRKFFEKVKQGKEKINFGFGGKGLDNLQEIRDSTKDLQRKVYGESEGVTDTGKQDSTANKPVLSETYAAQLPDFHIVEGRAPETAGPDKCKFHARVTINDLPQTARWFTVNRESLTKIIDSTGTSVTNKGQFYPSNAKIPKYIKQNGKDVPAPSKLYLLVEGLTESSVKSATSMLRSRMIEGLEIAAKKEAKAPTGKYTV
ncbi:Piso0_002766 [Millerozyma farinosa CBS 7064]|uniref:RNA helicase n=1 Tax=Pichia sorbitophila (strain ATCC MYA-4447 / BCRC 22081 / CBS 7064 / NBRC 10061 / NRRL Y-12695) TaxID=559304 RepID=G8YDG2_PICSO|nr:Piso0_002766 [Millerozyma farinosa CBS 7064]